MYYVTYDVQHEGRPMDRILKTFAPPGVMIHTEIGRFDLPNGGTIRGVRMEYNDPVIGPASEIIAVPEDARNVQVHADELPPEYRHALRSGREAA